MGWLIPVTVIFLISLFGIILVIVAMVVNRYTGGGSGSGGGGGGGGGGGSSTSMKPVGPPSSTSMKPVGPPSKDMKDRLLACQLSCPSGHCMYDMQGNVVCLNDTTVDLNGALNRIQEMQPPVRQEPEIYPDLIPDRGKRPDPEETIIPEQIKQPVHLQNRGFDLVGSFSGNDDYIDSLIDEDYEPKKKISHQHDKRHGKRGTRYSRGRSIPRNRGRPFSITETDIERNTHGTETDEVPNIVSQSSTRTSPFESEESWSSDGNRRNLVFLEGKPHYQGGRHLDDRSSPGKLVDGKYVYKKRDKHDRVIDIATYSGCLLLHLLKDGRILVEKTDRSEKRVFVTNNQTLCRIIYHHGFLYGVDRSGRVYYLKPKYPQDFSRTTWKWTLLTEGLVGHHDPLPKNIHHVSSTADGSGLLLQDRDGSGYLYDKGRFVKKLDIGRHMRRNYGKDFNHFVDIDDKKREAFFHRHKERVQHIKDVTDAILSYQDQAVVIKTDQKHEFASLRLVNWQPYYLLR